MVAAGGPGARSSPRWVAPSPRAAVAVAALGGAVVLLAALGSRPTTSGWQEAVVRWVNDPPLLLAAVLVVSNPLLRPVPLTVVSVLVVGWVLGTAADRASRLELARAGVLAFVVVELLAQTIKALLQQPRPAQVLSGLDPHGYPGDPLGSAFPSAHTAVAVAVLVSMWPGLGRWQRIAGVALAVLVAANRVYVGAHWPMDVLAGAGLGLVAAALAWLVATRWPIGSAGHRDAGGSG